MRSVVLLFKFTWDPKGSLAWMVEIKHEKAKQAIGIKWSDSPNGSRQCRKPHVDTQRAYVQVSQTSERAASKINMMTTGFASSTRVDDANKNTLRRAMAH